MKIGNKILNKLLKNKEIISANIVGSYIEKKFRQNRGYRCCCCL